MHVLRLSAGKLVYVTDGKGGGAVCELVSVSKKEVLLETKQLNYLPIPARRLHVAIAPTKNIDRIEWFVEKATEIGIAEITPLICHRSERKDLKLDRIRKLIVSAAKQAQRDWFPVLKDVVQFNSFMENISIANRFIAHCGEGVKAGLSDLKSHNEVIVLIGPEGDFTQDEVEIAVRKKFIPLSLGEARLRTETAGLVSVAAFNN